MEVTKFCQKKQFDKQYKTEGIDIMKTLLDGDIVFLFRNTSTNNPTKKHIINAETSKSFCGWKDDYYSEVHVNATCLTYEYECCQKCLKYYHKKISN